MTGLAPSVLPCAMYSLLLVLSHAMPFRNLSLGVYGNVTSQTVYGSTSHGLTEPAFTAAKSLAAYFQIL